MATLSDTDFQEIKDSIYVDVGRKVKRVRLQKGFTQVQLAHMIQSDRQYMYKIESGKVGLSLAKLAIIAKALEIPIRSLLP